MTPARCPHGNLLWPADRPFPAGDTPYCGACWRKAGGVGRTPPAPRRSLPCVHEGQVREYATCGDPARHVRECELHDGPCTRGPSRARSCQSCPDYSSGRREVHFHLSAHGIGDAVVGVYAACGLADAGHAAVFHCRQSHWLAGVTHPGVSVVPWAGDHGHDANRDYGGQLRAGGTGGCASRGQWYCDRIADLAGLPRFAPARPQTVSRPAPVIEPGYTLVAPFANSHSRDYPHWAGVVRRLTGRVVVVGSRREAGRLSAAFSPLPPSVSWHWGMPHGWVMAATANAGHVYGNDSGMVHLAGLYGVPATAVTAHLPGRFLFAEATSVRWVAPERAKWACSPCGWQGVRGFSRACQSGCAALASVEPGRVPLPVLAKDELDAALGVRAEGLVGVGQ